MADPYIGEIGLFSFTFRPRNWVLCDGALMTVAGNSALFSLLGTFYGGDGRTTFGLPDLRGRGAMGPGRHPNSLFDWRLGQTAGEEFHTMTAAEMPSHTHSVTVAFDPSTIPASLQASLQASTSDGTSATPSAGSYLATGKPPVDGTVDKPEQLYSTEVNPTLQQTLGGVSVPGGTSTGTLTIENNGAGSGFNIIQPILTMNFCMALYGTYPPRDNS